MEFQNQQFQKDELRKIKRKFSFYAITFPVAVAILFIMGVLPDLKEPFSSIIFLLVFSMFIYSLYKIIRIHKQIEHQAEQMKKTSENDNLEKPVLSLSFKIFFMQIFSIANASVFAGVVAVISIILPFYLESKDVIITSSFFGWTIFLGIIAVVAGITQILILTSSWGIKTYEKGHNAFYNGRWFLPFGGKKSSKIYKYYLYPLFTSKSNIIGIAIIGITLGILSIAWIVLKG